MSRIRRHVLLGLALFFAAAPAARAQREPHVGYVYPAGGQQGATFEVAVGGQFLDGASGVIVSGSGVLATISEFSKPLTQKEINQLRQKVQELRKRVQAQRTKGQRRAKPGQFKTYKQLVKEVGLTEEDLKTFAELRKKLADPKRQLNPQLAETVTLQVTLDADAETGPRELRLKTSAGLTNPIRFYVGQLPERREIEPNETAGDSATAPPLPVVFNGQIMPGDVDRFRFQAVKGQRLVVAAHARELMPYLADAVPGWFQATLAVYDADGKELAYDDDYRFHPDPVLFCEIPEDGQYVVEIKDAIYRGREDFVYRITVGELPFVTSIFPLGAPRGTRTTVEVNGWNLPVDSLTVDAEEREPGVHPISLPGDGCAANCVPFAVDTLPECLEAEPNDEASSAQQVTTPLIVNGRVGRPGDLDVFGFQARAGDEIVAEVQARRLGSPLDSVLVLTDASGKQLAANDDCEDKGAGLITHHADSRLSLTIPADGTYYLRLGDTQHQGGPACGYRLRISPPRPDFALRVVPSSINARAGATVPITVYALRKDGFSEDIALELKDPPPGFALGGPWVPAGQDTMRLTLTVPRTAPDEPVPLRLEGGATIDGQEMRREAVPAEDMMQAFIYRHLVPAQQWLVAVTGGFRGRAGAAVRLDGDEPVKLPAGGTARARFSVSAGPMLRQVELVLSDPPEGIAVEKVSAVQGGVTLVLRADAQKIKPGLKGNLIVEAFMQRAVFRKDGTRANQRRVAVGTLPAIPFEIVAP